LRGLPLSSGRVRGVWPAHQADGRLVERCIPELRERHIEAPLDLRRGPVHTFFVGALRGRQGLPVERHLFLQLKGIAHKRTRVSQAQSNGIVERLH
jgi:hypothetical protein